MKRCLAWRVPTDARQFTFSPEPLPKPHTPTGVISGRFRSRKTSFFKKSARKTKVGEKFQSSGEFGGRRRPCVYRKPRFGNIGDEGRDNRSKVVRFAGLKPE